MTLSVDFMTTGER